MFSVYIVQFVHVFKSHSRKKKVEQNHFIWGFGGKMGSSVIRKLCWASTFRRFCSMSTIRLVALRLNSTVSTRHQRNIFLIITTTTTTASTEKTLLLFSNKNTSEPKRDVYSLSLTSFCMHSRKLFNDYYYMKFKQTAADSMCTERAEGGRATSETNTKMEKKEYVFHSFTCSFFPLSTASERKKETVQLVRKDKARGKMDCARKRKKQLKF